MKIYIPSISNKMSSCHICLLAKQRRLPFTSNINMSAKAFDLIHRNTWGPFHISSHYGHRYFYNPC